MASSWASKLSLPSSETALLSSPGTTILLCALAFALVYLSRLRTGRVRQQLPPGPPALPLLGNLHQLPMAYQEHTLAEWGKHYGDVVYARIIEKPILVLNRAQIARELLEKRGAKYSGRPHSAFILDIVQWVQLVSMPYTERWRRHRRWFQTALQARNILNAYEPLQHIEVRRLLNDILREPDDVIIHLRRYVAALMLGIAYGHSPSSMDDEYIKMVADALHLVIEAGAVSSMLVDFIPFLKYLPAWAPGMGFKRRGLQARSLIRDMERIPLERVKSKMAAGTARPSVATALLEEATRSGTLDEAEEREIASVLGIMYGAGTDTTSTVLSTFILLMVLHPDVLRKAQMEVDSVIGDIRLPDINDRASLPYLDAVLKETYRWLAPVPLGVPHELTEPDEYNGFAMPEGSMVFTNLWAMLRDEEHYLNPDVFDPERFFGLSEDQAEDTDPRRIVFGFGRRICPGRFLADSSIFLAAANIIAVFDIRPARTADGKETLPQPSFIAGAVRHPKPFLCNVQPRSDKIVDLLMTAATAEM
ncbi:cytochrome P450 [Daedalea quercina L-15889]|uniref:Cytochrome P450 n=1 Tax=Daedalea quercina L-15889 TaxID=1314783 RepID=A0A165QEJ0_9APHY|nr:cytochrome P450 [Daedalea quercina L-15889]